jgi:hypothetical protein
MMRNLVLAMTAVASLVGGGALLLDTAGAQDEAPPPPPRRVIIGLDLSLSNPLIADPAFAAKVAQRIAGEVRGLGFGSEVHVRTFGNYDAVSNTFAYDAVLSVRDRPENVAADVGRLIAATPILVQQGKWRAQQHTNILAFLDNLSHYPGCGGMPTAILLATDGIEDSTYADLDHASSHLPLPEGRPFRGCADFEILGLGQGTRSPRETTRLRAEWQGWSDAAGFQHFVGLNDW